MFAVQTERASRFGRGPFLPVFCFTDSVVRPAPSSMVKAPTPQFDGQTGNRGAAPFRDTILIRQSELYGSVIVPWQCNNHCGEESGCHLPHGFWTKSAHL